MTDLAYENHSNPFLSRPIVEELRTLEETVRGSTKEAVAGESLSVAVRKDWTALDALSEAMARLSMDEAIGALVPAAQESVRTARTHALTVAANVLLDRQRGRDAMTIASLDLQTPSDAEQSSEERLAIHVRIAWSIPGLEDSLRHLRHAEHLDQAGEFGGYWPVAGALIRGRCAIAKGECDLASRLAMSASEGADVGSDLHLMSLELLAKAIEQADMEQRERAIRVQWSDAFGSADPPDSPAARARRLETSTKQPGLLATYRWQDIVQAQSRLAFLLERHHDVQGAAGLYRDMLEHGWHDWCDLSLPEGGSIRNRHRRAVSQFDENNEAPGDVLSLLHPASTYSIFGRPGEDEIENLLRQITSDPDPVWRGIVIGTVECRENQFAYDKDRGDPEEQLFEAITAVNRVDQLFDIRYVQVRATEGDCGPRILLSYRGEDSAMEGISFAARVAPIGPRAAWTMCALVVIREPTPMQLTVLHQCLGGPHGYELQHVLESKALELIRAAGRQASRHAGNISTRDSADIRW